MTHKSIDALLASTMFALFVFAVPNFTDVAKTIGFGYIAEAQTTQSTSTTTSSSNQANTNSSGTTCDSNTPPWLKITSPNSGEVYRPDDYITVTWDKCNTKGQTAYINLGVREMLLPGDGFNFSGQLEVPNTGSAKYPTPPTSFYTGDGNGPFIFGNNFKLMVSVDPETSYGAADESLVFSIEPPVLDPYLKVITPNGGETLIKGQTYRIKWEQRDVPAGVYVYILKDDRFYDGNALNSNLITSGYFDWTVPNSIPDGSNYKIEIGQGKGDPDQAGDKSDASFTIASQTTTNACTNWKVTAGGPQGGTYWEKLRDFNKHPEIDQYRIRWFNGNWSPWYTPTVDDKDTKVNNDGSWRYLISYKQDHYWETRECLDNQTQRPSITLLTPNGGENFPVGGKMAVRWKTNDISKDQKVYLVIWKNKTEDNPVHGFDLGENDGNEIVTIPDFTNNYPSISFPGGLYYLRIYTKVDDDSYYAKYGTYYVEDFSDNLVGIKAKEKDLACDSTTAPWVKVLSPIGKEVYKPGENVIVRWDSCNISGNIGIDFSSNPQPTNFGMTRAVTQNTGSYVYSLPNDQLFYTPGGYTYGNRYTFSVTSIDSNSVSGTSQVFSITETGQQPQNQDDDKMQYQYQTNVVGCKPGFNYSPVNGQACPKTDNTNTTNSSNQAFDYSTNQPVFNNASGNTPNQKAFDNTSDQAAFKRRLSRGQRGDDVRLLQQVLINQGYLKIATPNGYFGPQTYNAVRQFQAGNNISSIGSVGPATREALNSVVNTSN